MTQPETLQHQELAFYPLRSGEDVGFFVEALTRPPEKLLNEEERRDVLAFEHLLASGELVSHTGETLLVDSDRSIEEIWRHKSYARHKHEITLEYLFSPDAQAHREALGLDITEKTPIDDIGRYIRQHALNFDQSLLKDIAATSDQWSISQMQAELGDGGLKTEMTRMNVFSDIKVLAQTLQEYGAYRNFVAEASKDLERWDDSNAVQAKKTIVQIYRKVLNGELATLYPDALAVWDQLAAGENESESEEMNILRQAWPQGEKIAQLSYEQRREYILGLDRIRNGTTMVDGRYTAISPALRTYFEQDVSVEEIPQAEFSAEEVELLSSRRLDAYAMADYCRYILAELNLLSSESEQTYYDSPHRSHRAADNKWQVIVRTDKRVTAMGVEDPPGTLEIPINFYRTLTKATAPVGVISGAAHEIKHIYQMDNLVKKGENLSLAQSVRGRSSLALREAGGVYTEQRIQERLFGVQRPDSPHYMKALDILEQGGTENDAVTAFYESYTRANPTEPFEARVKDSISRVKRLCRRYGGFNSQPLNYAQTALIVKEAELLDERQRALLFAEGAFDLSDMASLHEFGLLSGDPEEFPHERYVDLAKRWLEQELAILKTKQAVELTP